jgi:hypothetical protein
MGEGASTKWIFPLEFTRLLETFSERRPKA